MEIFSVEIAELVAVRDDLRFAAAHNFRSLVVESDTINLVNSIKTKCILSSNVCLVLEIINLFKLVGG